MKKCFPQLFLLLLVQAVFAREWTDAQKNHGYTYYDLENYPLQITTDSVKGSDDKVSIGLYDETGSYVVDIEWRFSDYSYAVFYCTLWRKLTNVPHAVNKTWTLTKTSTSLNLKCNDVEVMNLDVYANVDRTLAPSCVGKMQQEIRRIVVNAYGDTASDTYLSAPEWEKVQQYVDYDLETYPLRIETDDGNDAVSLLLYTEVYNSITNITLRFTDNTYKVDHCTEYLNMANVADVVDKAPTFTVTKSQEALVIQYNDVDVVHIVYTDVDQIKYPDCVARLSQKAQKVTFDGASGRYLSREWTDVHRIRGSAIDYDLESYPLQITTDSVKGKKKVFIYLDTETGTLVTAIIWDYGDYSYRISGCKRSYLTNVPDAIKKTWTLTKTATSLNLKCNGVEVMKLVYDNVDTTKFPGCLLRQEVKMIKFAEWWGDSDTYLHTEWRRYGKVGYNLESYPLQIKTDSNASDVVFLSLYTEQDHVSDITWSFTDYRYYISYCTPERTPLTMVNVPNSVEKTWTITKSSESLNITCNGVQTVNLVFSDVDKTKYPECASKLSGNIKKIMFDNRYDNATNYYLSASIDSNT